MTTDTLAALDWRTLRVEHVQEFLSENPEFVPARGVRYREQGDKVYVCGRGLLWAIEDTAPFASVGSRFPYEYELAVEREFEGWGHDNSTTVNGETLEQVDAGRSLGAAMREAFEPAEYNWDVEGLEENDGDSWEEKCELEAQDDE